MAWVVFAVFNVAGATVFAIATYVLDQKCFCTDVNTVFFPLTLALLILPLGSGLLLV